MATNIEITIKNKIKKLSQVGFEPAPLWVSACDLGRTAKICSFCCARTNSVVCSAQQWHFFKFGLEPYFGAFS